MADCGRSVIVGWTGDGSRPSRWRANAATSMASRPSSGTGHASAICSTAIRPWSAGDGQSGRSRVRRFRAPRPQDDHPRGEAGPGGQGDLLVPHHPGQRAGSQPCIINGLVRPRHRDRDGPHRTLFTCPGIPRRAEVAQLLRLGAAPRSLFRRMARPLHLAEHARLRPDAGRAEHVVTAGNGDVVVAGARRRPPSVDQAAAWPDLAKDGSTSWSASNDPAIAGPHVKLEFRRCGVHRVRRCRHGVRWPANPDVV